MILQLLLPALERIVNRALQCDPDTTEKITPLNNQTIEIHCIDWKIKFYIICHNGELQFEKKYSDLPNTTVTGTLNNFLHIFIKGADTKTVFQYPIDITGNTHTIEVLRDVFKNIDIDFEEKLSHFIGDTLAHKICFHASETKNILENTTQKLTEQVKDYLHFEGKNLPTQKQAEQLYTDIATLRDDVARAEARILLLLDAKDSA